MQNRQRNRALYFKELAITSRKYYLQYIKGFKNIDKELYVLEIGCGEGGNLLPFSELGCKTTGIDISETRINDARKFFQERILNGKFILDNIFNINSFNEKYGVTSKTLC